MRAVGCAALLLATLGLVGACGSGRHVQRGVRFYRAENYPAAMGVFVDIDEGALNNKRHVRYLVYRGLTHYRLGERRAALHFLNRGSEAYRLGDPKWLPPYTVQQMQGALDDLRRDVRPPATDAPPPVAPPPATPPRAGPEEAPPPPEGGAGPVEIE
jgi:hypothetical protein